MIYTCIETSKADAADVMGGLRDVIQAVGTEGFDVGFANLMLTCFGHREFLVYQRNPEAHAPEVLLAQSDLQDSDQRARAYQAGFWKLDPVKQMLDDSPDGLYVIRIGADEIRNADYRTTCYTRPGIHEKITIVQKMQNMVTALSVFARGANGGFSDDQLRDLSQFANLIMPVLCLHFRIFYGSTRQKRASVGEMENCVSWAFPELSKREISVCARSILGVTAEGIALDLGIKQTSVLTYRRRAYARLNVNSINQLSTMLIQSAGARQMAAAS